MLKMWNLVLKLTFAVIITLKYIDSLICEDLLNCMKPYNSKCDL